MASLDVKDFISGITDNYLDGDPQAAKKLDNLVINENGKLVQHPGISIYNADAPQIPPGNQSIDGMYYFDSTLFVKSGTKLYYIEDGDTSWTTLAGPTSNDAFKDSELGAKCSWSEWRGHLFITPGPSANIKGGCRTAKVYRNAAGTWYLVQAGMPKFEDRDSGYTNFTSDIAGTHINYYSYIVASMFVRIYVAQVNGVDTVFKDYGSPRVTTDRDDDTDGGNIDWSSGNTYTNKTYENYDTAGLRTETYRTRADGTQFLFSANDEDATRNVDSASAGIATADSALGSTTIYAVVDDSTNAPSGIHVMKRKDIGFFYVDQEVSIDDSNSSPATRYVKTVNYSTYTLTLSATRGGAASDDTAFIKANNSTISFTYSSDIPAGYNEGNYNDPAPPAYFTIIADGYGWYLAPIDTALSNQDANHRATRILQSKPGDPDGAPSANYTEAPTDKLTAGSLFGQHPIAFARNKCFRLEGRIDAFGGGGIRAVLISESEGAICQDVIRTPKGLLFQSETGWCITDGFHVVNLSKNHLKDTYADLLNKEDGSGCYDSLNQRAYFGVESSDLVPTVSDKNNASYVLDMKRTGDLGVFTTVSAVANFQPASMHYDSKNALVLIGDSRGYVFKFDTSKKTWPVVDTGSSYADWKTTAIVWDWITCAFSFGTARLSKWMNEVSVICKNLTGNLSIDFYSYKDDRSTAVQMKAARDRSITSGLHKIKRSYPKGNLSCVYSQLQIKKGYVVIVRSDDYDQATFSNSGNTAQIASGTWPSDGTDDLVGHYIYPEIAGAYDTGWLITIDSGDTLTVSDAGNTFPDGLAKWVIKGYPKNEGVEIHAMGIEHQIMGDGYPERSNQGGNA